MKGLEALRGVIDEMFGGAPCDVIKRVRGKESCDDDESCSECMAETLRRIAGMIEGEMRATAEEAGTMPDGVEWPKVDGKPVDFRTHYEPSLGVLEAVSIYNTGACEVMSHDGIIKSAKDIHIAKPKVLDADGAEISEKCDVWWICEGDERGVHAERLRVETIWLDGLVECSPYNGGTWAYLEPSELYVNRPVLDADGVPIREGDVLYRKSDGRMVKVAEVYEKTFTDADDCVRPGDGFTHRAPVLAADGKPLREGETVWHVGNGIEFTVIRLPRPGEYQAVKLRLDNGAVTGLDPDQLTHQRPDSWERLEEDASQLDIDLNDTTDDYPRMSCCRDLVRRAKKLAGVSE